MLNWYQCIEVLVRVVFEYDKKEEYVIYFNNKNKAITKLYDWDNISASLKKGIICIKWSKWKITYNWS